VLSSVPKTVPQVTRQTDAARPRRWEVARERSVFLWWSTLELFHRNAMGTRWASFEGRVEVQLELLVIGESIVCDFENVDFMISFKVDNASSIFIEEVVCHHKATIVATQHQVVRSGVRAKADN
jgi:hypothetical protein